MTSREKANYILGIRAWGLILYGALPANLALLGALEVKLGNIEKLFPLIIPFVILLPILITYLLVRSRCREWYLTTDYLTPRSLITTFLIVLCATLISGASGIISGKYVFSIPYPWSQAHLTAMAESFLFGISSLVLTSTLFMTIFTKAVDLPWLPSSKFVTSLDKIRNHIRSIKRSPIYLQNDDSDDYETVKEIQEIIKKIREAFEELMSYPLRKITRQSLETIEDYIESFDEALEFIKKAGGPKIREDRWKIFFEKDDKTLTGELRTQRKTKEKQHSAVLMIKDLRIGE